MCVWISNCILFNVSLKQALIKTYVEKNDFKWTWWVFEFSLIIIYTINKVKKRRSCDLLWVHHGGSSRRHLKCQPGRVDPNSEQRDPMLFCVAKSLSVTEAHSVRWSAIIWEIISLKCNPSNKSFAYRHSGNSIISVIYSVHVFYRDDP